ncbi:MAG: hypothetical protein LBR42_03115 [Candidatus Methanoplasma sp.]|jgi:hypothetical protein|nr:hypothetical protein [Candidatus Methanoplasma sp.]
MTKNRCPNCGEKVESNCLTCPKCFAEIPRSQSRPQEYVINEESERRSSKIPTVALLLSIIPPFIGLLGLGLIYLHPRDRKGYWFLIIGLLLFLCFLALFFTMLESGFFSAVLLFVGAVIVLLIYISAAIAALLEAVFGSVFKVLRF